MDCSAGFGQGHRIDHIAGACPAPRGAITCPARAWTPRASLRVPRDTGPARADYHNARSTHHYKNETDVATAPHCPHCRKQLPRKLVWRTLFAGQTAPPARPAWRFRLTYPAKIRVGFLNVAIVLGFAIVAGYAFIWTLPEVLRNVAGYLAITALILVLLPHQARYEKLGKSTSGVNPRATTWR